MRILHILDHSLPLHSGYTFRTLSILRESQALGWETIHLTSPKQGGDPAVRDEIVDGWQFFRTPPVRGLVTDLPVMGELELMGELSHRIDVLVRRFHPHIIHAHSPVLNVLPALRVGRRRDVPVVYEIRAFWEDAAVDHGTTTQGGLRYRMTRKLETYVAKRVDHVFTICEGLRNDLVGRGLPQNRVTVIPNGVDVDKFSGSSIQDAQLAEQLGIAGKTVLGFLGSFYGYEGLGLLLSAMPGILQARADVRLLLVGGGYQEDALRQQAKELGISDKIVFTGRVPHDHVQRYYDLVDVIVCPRLSMRLTELVTPLKPLEAMAQGRLVLASDVGGHRELIRDGETGTLFKAGSVDDLVHKALALLGNREAWPKLRESGRMFVEKERTWKSSVAQYADVYERLLTARRYAA